MSVRTSGQGVRSARRRWAVNPTNLWKPSQQVDGFLAANPELAPIAAQPAARWINNQSDADAIPAHVTAAAGKTILLSVYAIPGRDSGNYSAGGFPDRASYLSFIQSIKTYLGSAPAIISYEADALGLANGMSAAAKAERIETLRQAVNILATIPQTETYVEASQWVSPADQTTLLQAVDVHLVHGFSLNTSGYESQSDCYSYGNDVVSRLAANGVGGRKYIVDSSRNGNGVLKESDRPLASPWLDTSQAWCNPPQRLLGLAPGTVSEPNCRATLWIKAPGESDGTFPTTAQSSYFGENAPAAGVFWVRSARMLCGLSPAPAAANALSSVTANFTSDYGPFSERSGGVSLVAGRARITSDATYQSLSTPSTYTAASSSVHAEVYAGATPGGATHWIQMLVDSTAAPSDTRLCIQVGTNDNTISFRKEAGYYDPNGVYLTYDPTAHRCVRIREASGQVYFETAPATSGPWTTRYQTATPSWLTSTANSRAVFVAYSSTGSSYFEVDNVNV